MTKTAKEWVDYYNSDEFKQFETYQGNDLGAVCQWGGSTIKLWSPVADSVTVNFYKDGEPATKAYWREPMTKSPQGIWSYYIRESLHGTYYDFTLVIDGEEIQSPDPYAKAAGINGVRSLAIDMARINPDNWNLDKAPAVTNEQIIDEIHVKEFSWLPEGGWPSEMRGKYLAFTKADTVLAGTNQPTGLGFLKNLGITHVQLMPIYDYGSVDEVGEDNQFNWGYDPVNYNVPEGSYASDAHHGEVRINELKQAIQSLHQNGFRVVMDVVYNHTYNLDNALQKTMPYYFYRLNDDGTLSNGSGCGNDIASERPKVHKYIVDSVMFWAREYHMDGFRFDLMGLLDVNLMNDIRKQLDDKYGVGQKLVYGEPWSADRTAIAPDIQLANKANMGLLDNNIGMFCDDTRDSIKGSAGNLKATGFVNGAPDTEQRILNSVVAWCNIKGSNIKAPSQIINYASAHDNQTLWDKLSETTPDDTIRRCQYRLAVAIYLTCQGRPFMLSGSSFLRTKGGNDNSHNAPIEINRLDWRQLNSADNITDYYSGLIALRQLLPGLYDKSPEAYKRVYNTWFRDGLVGYMVDNKPLDEQASSPWQTLTVVYNRRYNPAEFELDEGEWEVLASQDDTRLWQAETPTKLSGTVSVDRIGWLLLGRR